jgi:hypothetical protein
VLGRFLSLWDEYLTVGANFGLRECLFTSWVNYRRQGPSSVPLFLHLKDGYLIQGAQD